MDSNEISKYRASVIESLISLERLIDCIISQHYFSEIHGSFLNEVLYDEYFSFGLKRKILEKICPRLDSKTLQSLNRINSIRNIFAHCASPIPEEPHKVKNPKKLNTELDLENLYLEFKELKPIVNMKLFHIYQMKGGEISEG